MSNSKSITTQNVTEMVKKRDFSSVENQVPDLVAFLVNSSPQMIKSVLDVACENRKLKKDIIKYTHESAVQTLKTHSEIVKIEAENLKDVNQSLGTTLINFSKKEDLTKEELEIYLTTLQMIGANTSQLSKVNNEHEAFVERVEQNEKEILSSTQKDEFLSTALKVMGDMVNTPQGRELVANGIYKAGYYLYKGLSKIYSG